MSRGPVITLVAVAALGLGLWGLDAAVQPSAPSTSVSASSAPPAPPPVAQPTPVPAAYSTYVGEATSGQGTIPMAITVDKGQVKAYVCDGHKVEAWMQGNATSSDVTASGKSDNHMDAHVSNGHITGTMRAGHQSWSFDVPSSHDHKAGIYRSSSNGRTSGWVVQGRNKQTGLTQDGNEVVPAAPLPLDGPLPPGVSVVDGTTDVVPSP